MERIDGTVIPKIIHQTLPDKFSMPDLFRENVESLQSMNPGWTHVLYDNQDVEDFISSHYAREIRDAYLSINPLYGAARADLFRYLVVLKEGGVYLDIKSGCSVPLDTIIRPGDECLLSRWNNGPGEMYEGFGMFPHEGVPQEFQNWHLFYKPDHPYLAATVDSVLENLQNYRLLRHGIGKMGVLRTTGPFVYTKVIERVWDERRHRMINAEACGLRYSTVPVKDGLRAHKQLFRSHYDNVCMPIVSSGKETSFHRAYYGSLRSVKRVINRMIR